MSLASGDSEKNDRDESWLPFSLSIRFAVAITGIVICWWLASRQDVQKLHPLPTFDERLQQVAPALTAGAAAIIFVFWLVSLAGEYKVLSASKLTTALAAGDRVQVQKGQLTTARRIFLVAIAAIFVVAFGKDDLKFLWPSYPLQVSSAADLAINLLVVFAFFFQPSGKKKAESPLPKADGGLETER